MKTPATHLLTSDDLDAVEAKFRANAVAAVGTGGSAALAWLEAYKIIATARRESLARSTEPPPSARRKTLGLRYTR